MITASRRHMLQGGLFGVACACVAPGLAFAADSPSGKWMCPPCGCASDGKEFDKAGACPSCGMDLVPKPAPKDGAAAPKSDG